MQIRTAEASQPEYPEAEITAAAKPDRRASFHSKNIPEARLEVMSVFPNRVLASVRPKREDRSNMQAEADVDRSRFPHFDQRRQHAATLQRSTRAQATFQAPPDHEEKSANRAVQLIAGRSNFRAKATVARRSGTGDAGSRASRVPSLPFLAIHHFRQPAIPDGRRSGKQYTSN